MIHQCMTECLQEGEGTFSLAPGRPIEQHGVRYVELECFAYFYEELEDPTLEDLQELGEAELFLKTTALGEAGKNLYSGHVLETDIPTAENIMKDWLQGVIPNMTDWEATPMW